MLRIISRFTSGSSFHTIVETIVVVFVVVLHISTCIQCFGGTIESEPWDIDFSIDFDLSKSGLVSVIKRGPTSVVLNLGPTFEVLSMLIEVGGVGRDCEDYDQC